VAKSQNLLLQEAFAYHIAIHFRCGDATIREFEEKLKPANVAALRNFEEKLKPANVAALRNFANQIQCKLQARGAGARAGSVQ